MKNQKGVVHLVLPVLLLVIIGAGIYLLFSLGVIKNPLDRLRLPGIGQQAPKVSIKSEYKNPFKKTTQYVNPFDSYKNPFLVAK